MFTNLLASTPRKPRSMVGLLFSGAMHAILGTAAVYGTLQARERLEKPEAQRVEFVAVRKQPPPPKDEPKPVPNEIVVAPPQLKGFQVLISPIKVPDTLPDIDVKQQETNANDYPGIGIPGGTSKGVVGGATPIGDQPYFEFQVEKPVRQIPGSGNLRYPDMLRSANTEGEVLAQFIVDETGRYEPGSFTMIESSHEQFTQAVKSALPNMRFYPAEVGGKKVKQLVRQPFTFALTKR